jgi:glycosyltransferase involved in cell wall biosynthesis
MAMFLNKEKFSLSFILIHDNENTDFKFFLDSHGIQNYYIPYKSKKDLLSAIVKSFKILSSQKCDVVHAHLFEASLIGMISSKLAGIKKRIYTRHYSTLHHEYFPQAVKWDRFINFMATDIVSISNSTYYALSELENVEPCKIKLIPHGFKLDSLNLPDRDKVEKLKLKYNPMLSAPVIGVVARYIELKGIEYIIRAFKELLNVYPKAKLVLANATGDYSSTIQNELQSLAKESYVEIPFESDIVSLYHLFNIYVHVPVNKNIEAFGQTYVESMAAGIPGIFTLSGIGNQLCKHEHNCLVVDYKNSSQICDSMLKLLQDNILRKSIIENAGVSTDEFGLKPFIEKLESLYS